MLKTPSEEQFLKKSDLNQIIDIMQQRLAPFSHFSKQGAMEWLKLNRPVDYYVVLGCMYGIAVYQVTGTGVTEGCPKEEVGLYFASTDDGDFEDAPWIPLQETMENSYRITCELLGLEKLFQRECELGESLQRRSQGPSESLSAIIPHLVAEVRAHERMDVAELHMKISEENGELAQAILAERGKLPGKKLKEPAMGEGADVIIATISALAKHYQDLSPDQLAAELSKWVNIKMDKYKKKLHETNDAS